MKILFVATFILANLIGCPPYKELKEIKFGEGGGVTGEELAYELKPNGNILKGGKKIKTISREKMLAVANEIEKLSSESLRFNHPDNVYYFIETKKEDNKARIVWGDPTFPVPVEVKKLYDHLQEIVNP